MEMAGRIRFILLSVEYIQISNVVLLMIEFFGNYVQENCFIQNLFVRELKKSFVPYFLVSYRLKKSCIIDIY